MAPPVRIAVLGGLGEVGMNCMALECEGSVSVVDCGLLLPGDVPGAEVAAPDLSWLRERAAAVGAIFLTHGHEDHLGALPLLLRGLAAPVFGPRFALAVLRRRLEEAGVEADLREVAPGDVRGAEGSPLSAEFLSVAHSVPDACGLALRTPQGLLLHSGDFKIDERPVAGRGTDLARVEALGRAGVRLLLSDSTNAGLPGRSPSETAVRAGLEEAMERAQGRVLVACTTSHVHRIQQVADAARARGRRLSLLGRSMEEGVRLALGLGLLSLPAGQLASLAEIREAPPREGCVLVSGAQGEPGSALSRLARGGHPDLSLAAGDVVIFSSRPIPGGERAVREAMDGIWLAGAEVAQPREAPLHATGHAQEGELRELIRLSRPRAFLPIHGEFRQLARHAACAAEEGVGERLLARDGDLLELGDGGIRVLAGAVPAGRIYADRAALERGAAEAVVRERRRLAEAGVVLCVAAVDRESGAVVRGPELAAFGVAGFEGAAEAIRSEALEALRALTPPVGRAEREEALRLAVRRWFRRQGLRRPLVEPVVLEM